MSQSLAQKRSMRNTQLVSGFMHSYKYIITCRSVTTLSNKDGEKEKQIGADAYIITVEVQSRGTWHGHIQQLFG